MNLLELQQRANILVDKVNQYEASLTGTELDENQVLNQHTYVDIFCLRPVLKLLFGKDVSDKLSRTLENDIELPLVSSTAPAWNTFFNFFNQEVTSNQHEFIQNIDTYNSSNMLMLDTQQYTLTDRDTAISLGIRYSYGANIGDALVTESQVSNLFNWNTTNDTTVLNNTKTTNRQVPGIVLYYLGNDYNGVYTATIPYSRVLSNINTVNDNNPPLYGAYYDSSDITKSQVGLDMGAECCRIFIPGCNYLGGKLISPQQIWQPDRKVGSDNIGYGYNWQGKAVYHELVFKNRRSGCSNSGVDFIPGLDSVPDNDVQGLATRVVLAQMKNYYYNRPWFNELKSLYEVDTSKLANKIIENANTNVSTGYALADFLSFNNNSIIDTTTGNFDFPENSKTDYVTFNSVELLNGTYDFIISFIPSGIYVIERVLQTSAYYIQIEENFIRIRKTKRNEVIGQISKASSNTTYTLKLHVENNASLTIYNLVDSEFTQIGTTTGDMSITSATLGLNEATNVVMAGDILGASSYIENNSTKHYLAVEQFEQQSMNDTQFYNSYQLNYDTFADAFGFSK